MERGRSLSELGRSLRWSDLYAFIQFLPPNSHTKKVLAPDLAKQWERNQRVNEWNSPVVRLLGQIFDSWYAIKLASNGAQANDMKPIVWQLATQDLGLDEEASQEEKPAKRKQLSAAEIRARVAKNTKP